MRVQPLFLVLAGAAAAFGLQGEMLLLLALLGTHELAHLMMARAFGLDVVEVELWPFGGVARIEGLEWAEPGAEAAVALAGPLNNLMLLAGGLGLRQLGWLAYERGSFFLTANLVLGLFNLLPALPLDGGRVLRALLAQRRGHGGATRLLCDLGRHLGWLLGLAGLAALLTGRLFPGLFVYAVFLSAAAARERRAAGFHALRQLWRRSAGFGLLPVNPLAADPGVRLGDALRRLAPHRYHLIWVVDAAGGALGRLDEADLLRGLQEHGPDATLGRLLGR